MTKRRSTNRTAPRAPIVNTALPASTGVVRVSPQRMWSSRALETMSKNRNRVEVSRFLQEEIPVVDYMIRALPQEAVGKGIGAKSISANPAFKERATAFFKLWASGIACDLAKEATWYDLQARWLSAILGDGSCFVQKVLGGPETRQWSLAVKTKRRCQFQTFTRDQIATPRDASVDEKWNDGLLYNDLGQLVKIGVLQQGTSPFSAGAVTRSLDVTSSLGGSVINHLKENVRFNQQHGTPALFRSNADLLDTLDLKAVRKHSAKIRASLLGVTTSGSGEVPNAMRQVMAAEKSGSPPTDTGKRYVEIHEGAVMIPLAVGEDIKFFTSQEAIDFGKLLEQLTTPMVFNFGYPPEWIFSMGSLGGTASRAVIEKVRRAHDRLRRLLLPHIQWCWEFVIGDAMQPGGPLYEFATVEDWNEIDFVLDPDPSVDLGRDHKADMERWGENLITAEDYVESRTGGSGVSVRHAAIDEKLDNIRYAIERGTPIGIPASICTLIGLGPRAAQSASGLIASLQPEQLAAELGRMDAD